MITVLTASVQGGWFSEGGYEPIAAKLYRKLDVDGYYVRRIRFEIDLWC